jgi:hypothetical protein
MNAEDKVRWLAPSPPIQSTETSYWSTPRWVPTVRGFLLRDETLTGFWAGVDLHPIVSAERCEACMKAIVVQSPVIPEAPARLAREPPTRQATVPRSSG